MSSPYVYTPQQYQAFQPNYLDPYYTSQPVNSPFIPDATLYPASPYTSAPNTPRRVHFDDLWTDPPPRQRRPSWHAGLTPAIGPVQLPASGYASPFLQPTMPFFNTHTRRRSFGDTTSIPYRPYHNPWTSSMPWLYPTQQDTFLIHPYLNGETPRPDFHFDLSSPTFSPMRLVAPGQSGLLSLDELNQPATHPPITRLRIICDSIPQWPIELQYNPYASAPTLSPAPLPNAPVPITLGDVLIAMHRSLQTRISHIDWARLSMSEETAIAKAYTRRCRAMPQLAQFEASQGVRRIDYLLDKVVFRGLVRVLGMEGFETLRLLTG